VTRVPEEAEEILVLSVGRIVGGSTVANEPWRDAILDLTRRIAAARRGIEAPLNLNVVFHVPGNMAKPEFAGVRTGTFAKRHALLMVQVAVPEDVAVDPAAHVVAGMYAAIDEAENWAARRKVPADTAKLREIVARAS